MKLIQNRTDYKDNLLDKSLTRVYEVVGSGKRLIENSSRNRIIDPISDTNIIITEGNQRFIFGSSKVKVAQSAIIFYTAYMTAEELVSLQALKDLRSAFNPTQLEGNVLTLQADKGITLVGSDVDEWQDQSGNGNDASAPAAINRPLYVINAINGKPVLRGDGVNSHLVHSASLGGGEGTVFVVTSVRSGQTGFRGLMSTDGDNDNEVMVLARSLTDNNWGTFEKAPDSTYLPSNSNIQGAGWKILTLIRNGAGSGGTFYNNGATDGSFTGDCSGQVGHVFGSLSSNQIVDADIAEIIIYNRALSASERNQVEQYLSDKYAIALA